MEPSRAGTRQLALLRGRPAPERPVPWWEGRLGPAWTAALHPAVLTRRHVLGALALYEAELARFGPSVVLPPTVDRVFAAFRSTPFDRVRVVVLGQDPYGRAEAATGLAFSVGKSAPRVPPSLVNIYREIEPNGCPNGDLTKWARQGVLLLNTILTVRAGKPLSHRHFGWQEFVDDVLRAVAARPGPPRIFFLWGEAAKAKKKLILAAAAEGAGSQGKADSPPPADDILILEAPHPSPSNGAAFRGCDHFNKANAWLTGRGLAAIDWHLPPADSEGAAEEVEPEPAEAPVTPSETAFTQFQLASDSSEEEDGTADNPLASPPRPQPPASRPPASDLPASRLPPTPPSPREDTATLAGVQHRVKRHKTDAQ